MPFYESVFIARPDISAAQVEGLVETFTALVAAQGGSVTKTEYWGLRNLAYRIKKARKGHYTLLNLDAPAATVAELERNMRINEDVVRYLTVRVDALEEGPSAMMQVRRDRDDRGRRRDRDDRRDRGDRGDRDRGDRGDRDRGERGDRDRGERREAAPRPEGARPEDARPEGARPEGEGAAS